MKKSEFIAVKQKQNESMKMYWIMNKASGTNSSTQNKVDQIKQIFKVLDTINDLTQISWIQDHKII